MYICESVFMYCLPVREGERKDENVHSTLEKQHRMAEN